MDWVGVVVAAIIAFISGVIGVFYSPRGKDYVARKAFEREQAAAKEERQRLAAEAEDQRERDQLEGARRREEALFSELTTALEGWRAAAPFVELQHHKRVEQVDAQERVRSLGPRVEDEELRNRLAALVDGTPQSFAELHAEAVARLAVVAREKGL